MDTTRPPKRKRTPGIAAMLVAALIGAAGIAAPAAAQSTGETQVFRPVRTARHALLFAPTSVPAEAVQSARVRVHNRHTHASRTRRLRTERVRSALEQGSRIRIHKARRARGLLKVKLTGEGGDGTPPPPDPDPSATPTDWRRFASFESTLNAGTDFGWRLDSPFSTTRTSEVGGIDGSSAAKIVTNGGNSSCSCPRMTFEDGFSFGRGDEFWMGGSWRLPNTSKLAWSRLMNLAHWGSGGDSDWHIQFESTDSGSFQVGYAPYHGPKVRLVSVSIPEGRWFSIDVRVKLSPRDGQALTEVYLDGRLVGSTTKANMYSGGGPLEFYNAGLSYFWPGNGSTTVYFDAARLGY